MPRRSGFHAPAASRVSLRLWIAVIALIALIVGAGARAAGVPAPHMLAGLFTGMAFALAGAPAAELPRPAYRLSQALAGVLMGSHLDPAALARVVPALLPLVSVTVVTVILSVSVAYLLCRSVPIDRTTATLAMMPGGSSAMVAVADDLGADTRLVAIAQYLRVGVIASTAPLVVPLLGPAATRTAAGPPLLVGGAGQGTGLLVLCAVVMLGVRAGRWLRLPAPLVLGPMLSAAIVTVTGAAHGFAPAGVLQDLVFTGIGLEIGLRFSRESLRHARSLLVPLLAGTLALSLACALLAWPLSGLAHLPYTDTYLATAPGGINSVLPTAVATHANVALISSLQSLRLFAVVALAPPLIRCLSSCDTKITSSSRTNA
jgi:membrane AbrB-like protein